MFFDDPVRAFTNLRRAAKPAARLDCIVWRSAAENPFMTTAERAAAPLLPDIPPRRPDGPGQFAFADPQRVQQILSDSGWSSINFAAVDIPCVFPATELEHYSTRMGPVGLVLQQTDEATRSNVGAVVQAAFAPFVHGAEVRFDAACWQMRARAVRQPLRSAARSKPGAGTSSRWVIDAPSIQVSMTLSFSSASTRPAR